MRIIHTADWHLNHRLGRIDQTADLLQRVDQIAALCRDHQADVLAIAGDLFYERADRKEIAQTLYHLRTTFKPFFTRGGSILAVTGNHDKDHIIDLVRAGMGLAAPAGVPLGGTLLPGRMYLFNGAWFGKLRAPGDNFDTQFVMLPYPFASRYLEEEERRQCQSPEELHRAVRGKVTGWLRNLPDNRNRYDETARTVLVAHLGVVGADLSRGLFKLTEKEDILLDDGNVPTWPDYVALGHIHKPQCLKGLPHIRYPGSLDRLDFGERDDEQAAPRGVVLVEIGPTGRRGEPEVLKLPPTPMYDVQLVGDTLSEAELRAQYPEAKQALARITVQYRVGVDSRDAIDRKVRALFPRFTHIDWWEVGRMSDPGGHALRTRTDFPGTVRAYLERHAHDSEKNALLQLADHYLGKTGEEQP
jgi:DNA repair exonuclease SbcCD nuclease subunit